MNGDCLQKRKRQEHIVEPNDILGQSSQYHLADYHDQRNCKKVCIADQDSSTPDQGILQIRQQLTINAHIGSLQSASTVHPACSDDTFGSPKSSCEYGLSGNITAKPVCFGMVRIYTVSVTTAF